MTSPIPNVLFILLTRTNAKIFILTIFNIFALFFIDLVRNFWLKSTIKVQMVKGSKKVMSNKAPSGKIGRQIEMKNVMERTAKFKMSIIKLP